MVQVVFEVFARTDIYFADEAGVGSPATGHLGCLFGFTGSEAKAKGCLGRLRNERNGQTAGDKQRRPAGLPRKCGTFLGVLSSESC
jgi:hypothetical protein